MTDAISSSSPSSSPTVTLASVASASNAETQATVLSTATETQPKTVSSTVPVSPHMVLDPSAGVMISEYYNASGNLQSQIPSAAAVSYLRMGLSSSGAPKTEDNVEGSVVA